VFEFYYSSSELELVSLSSEANDDGDDGGGDAKVSLNVDTGREVGKIALRSRSDLTSLGYFSVFCALVSVTIVEMFCIIGSVSVLAICIVPAVLFKIMPSGKDDNFINVPFMRS
jgi:hypothetical protein